jgi:cytoskeleton protein RodZ
MAVDNRSSAFGSYLQAARKKRGMRLCDVSRQTKITIAYLRFLEEENLANLPEDAFVRGFIRAYAQAVNANADEALKRYYLKRKNEREIAKTKSIPIFKKIRSNLTAGGVFFVIGVLCVGGILVYFVKPDVIFRSDIQPVAVQNTVNGSEASRSASKSQEKAEQRRDLLVNADNQKPVSDKGKMTLEVMATQVTWLKVIIDEVDINTYNLSAGDRIQLSGSRKFNLLIGDVASVTLTLDGQPVKVSGRPRQPINIEIP